MNPGVIREIKNTLSNVDRAIYTGSRDCLTLDNAPGILRKVPGFFRPLQVLKRNMLCDAHIHTNYSDGALSPRDVFTLAAAKNVGTIAITDHNCLGNIIGNMALASETAVDYTFGGAELSLINGKTEFHFKIFFNPFADLKPLEQIVTGLRQARGKTIYKQAQDLHRLDGKALNRMLANRLGEKYFAKIVKRSISRQFATDLLCGFIDTFGRTGQSTMDSLEQTLLNTDNLVKALGINQIGNTSSYRNDSQEYHAIKSFASVFYPFPGYIDSVDIPGFEETLKRLKAVNAWVSLAHPERYERKGVTRKYVTELIKDLREKDLINGIETQYPSYDDQTRVYFTNLASSLKLAKDGGSDFHSDKTCLDDGEIGTGFKGNVKVAYLLFEKIRDFLTAPICLEASQLSSAGKYWEAFVLLRQASRIDPYKFTLYDDMADLLVRIKSS